MSRSCLVCGESAFIKKYNDTLLKCEKCGFVTANTEVDLSILNSLYTENYFKGEEYVDYLRDKSILQKNFSKRLKDIHNENNNETSSALEIGCAYGFFAELFTLKFQNTEYIGYDIVPEAIEYGQKTLNQNIFCNDYLKIKDNRHYSHVFMWDVIEHLPNPEKFIEKISNEIKEGGKIYITTGDIDRFIPKFQKEKWRMIHPPSHLHYFSRKTLSNLLEKYGFEITKCTYPPVHRSIRLIFYSLFMLRKNPSKFIKKLYTLIPIKTSIPINTFDIMFMVAQKKANSDKIK